MTCKFCGNEISEGADVCFICGQPVEQPAEAPEREPASEPVVEEAAPAEAVYAPEAPVAPPVVAVAPAPAPAPAAAAEPEKKSKKKKEKDPNRVGKFLLFICALLPFIGALVYVKNRKNDARKVSIANATFVGLNIWLFIIVVVCFKNNFFPKQ